MLGGGGGVIASYYSARICRHIAVDVSTAASRYGIKEGLKQQQLCSALLQVFFFVVKMHESYDDDKK